MESLPTGNHQLILYILSQTLFEMILWQVNVWDSCLPTVTAVLFSLVTEITLLKFERLQFSSKHSTVIQPTSLRVSIYICVGPAYQWPILKTEMQDSPELIIRTGKAKVDIIAKAVSLVVMMDTLLIHASPH